MRGLLTMLAMLGLVACGAGGGPSEGSASEYVEDLSNVPEFEAAGIFAFDEPRTALDVQVEGECAAVRFQEEGRDLQDTAFLRWEGDNWQPVDIVTGPDAFDWLDPEGEFCYSRP